MELNAVIYHASMHLTEDELHQDDSTCPFCASFDRVPSYLLQENPKILLLTCLNCGASSASRMPTNETLFKYYNKYYINNKMQFEKHITFDDPPRFAKHLVKQISEKILEKNITILDFGGGDGSIACALGNQLNREVVEITVVDYSENCLNYIRGNTKVIYKKKLDEVMGQFNLVIASAVIEHLPNPNSTLIELLAHLQPGGIFYARTPSVLPLMKICSVFGIKWDFTYPAHIHDLGQEFWEKYFQNPNISPHFKVLDSRPSIVETSFKMHFFRTLAAYALKLPWILLGRRYKLVGGWEIFVQRA